MNTKLNSEENFNELVFENKNKAYGAYAIRKSYNDNVTISLVLSSIFFGLLALLAILLTSAKVDIPDIIANGPVFIPYGTEVIIPKVDKPALPPKQKVETPPESNSGQKVASDDPQKSDGKINEQQNISKTPSPFPHDSSTGKDPDIKVTVLPEKKKEVVKFVDVMPSLKNMAKFIADNLEYPRQAIENGTAGIVYVTFVVEVDGSITDIKLLQGIGDGCEQEAMRVVGIMPLWEPGTLKNIPQRVQCNLPIKFRIK